MPMHIYPVGTPTSTLIQPLRSKRRQVKNACTHCQKACKKCDDARPCLRCVRYGVTDGCISSQRKERKKGYTRGPYKKRDGKSNCTQPAGALGSRSDTLLGSFGQEIGVQPLFHQHQSYYMPNQPQQHYWGY